MGTTRRFVVGVCCIAQVCITGCNGDKSLETTTRPIGVAEATLKANERIDNVLTGFAAATEDTSTSDSTVIASDGLLSALGEDPCDDNSSSDASTASNSVKDGPDKIARALSKALGKVRDEAKEHIFREEFVEFQDGNHVIYKLDPAKTCGSRSKCIDQLTRDPVRFDVTANQDDSLNITMLIGTERHSPMSFVLSDNKMAATGNLAEVMDSLRVYLDDEDESSLPEKLVGITSWSIEKLGPSQFVLSSSLLERFELFTGQAKGKPISVAIEPTSPLSEISVNSATNSLGFKENLGAVTVSVGGALLCKHWDCSPDEANGTFGLRLAGLTGQFETNVNANEITFSGLGLGADTSYVSVNNKHLAEIDLNRNAGRKFSMTLKKTESGTLVTFEPALDLRIAMAMNQLSESLRIDMPEWLMNEVFDVTFGGAPKPSVLIPPKTCGTTGAIEQKEQAMVTTGSLRLNSSSLQSPIEVMAGMCLVSATAQGEEPHPFTRVAAGTCQ